MDKHKPTHAHGRTDEHIRQLRTRLAELAKKLSPRERLRDGVASGLTATVAALAAYLPTRAFGLQEGLWAAIAAIFVAQSELGASRTTARDQLAGAAIGSVISLVIIMMMGRHIASYGIAVALSILCAWLLNVSTAAKLAGVTATILLLAPHEGPAEMMMLSRIFEVGWGICAAIATVWIATYVARRR